MIKKALKIGFSSVTSITGAFNKAAKASIITAAVVSVAATAAGIVIITRKRDENGKIKDSQGK